MKCKRLLGLAALLFVSPLFAEVPKGRFSLAGDGTVTLANAKRGETIRYRRDDGSYPPSALKKINRLFGAGSEEISLRLISLLDYLQDHFHAGSIRVISGYRSPEYNAKLRRRGKLAASTSLHLEGMAADIEIPGVEARRLWEFARSLDCCGVGYYHGKGIHIDTGPSRFWDEKTSGVEKNLGAHNKLILLRTDQDIYQPGETVRLILARITDYPIGVSREAAWNGEKTMLGPGDADCLPIRNRREARQLRWEIPAEARRVEKKPIQIRFCEKNPEMPSEIESNPIDIRLP